MGRGDLSNAEWELIGPSLLPPERGRWGRPAGDNRRFLDGMLHVLRVGSPGSSTPPKGGLKSTTKFSRQPIRPRRLVD